MAAVSFTPSLLFFTQRERVYGLMCYTREEWDADSTSPLSADIQLQIRRMIRTRLEAEHVLAD